tara:strand:+ start:465 stop:788 length:324 start_codon:yes stop_codon:yes gene_type:complete
MNETLTYIADNFALLWFGGGIISSSTFLLYQWWDEYETFKRFTFKGSDILMAIFTSVLGFFVVIGAIIGAIQVFSTVKFDVEKPKKKKKKKKTVKPNETLTNKSASV